MHASILVICRGKNRVNIFKSQKSNILTKRIFVLFHFTLFVLWQIFKTFKFSEHTWMYPGSELRSHSHLRKNLCYFLDWKPFQNDEKWFLFHLKSFFRPQDISVFAMTFWSCRKNSLIRKIRLTSKFMMLQPGLQTIAIRILLNISQSKGNQTMKFGQLLFPPE